MSRPSTRHDPGTRRYSDACPRWSWPTDGPALASVLLLGAAFALTAVLSSPHRFYTVNYLVGDAGWHLYIVDAL